MGRPSKPKREHKKKVSISIPRFLLNRIDELKEGRTRSELVQSMIETIVFNEEEYAIYMMRQHQLLVDYWKRKSKSTEE